MYLLSHNPRLVYLHGFASSPKSRKAQFFADHFRAVGVPLEIPDLANGEFHKLTIGSQLKLLENITGSEPAILIGSSLGGYLAALHAVRNPRITKLILLAPAFDFYHLWTQALGPERLAGWERTGTLTVFHYGAGRELPLSYEFLADASRFEAYPPVKQPILIFHGTQDQVVPIEKSIAFAGLFTQTKLVHLASGHELTDVLDSIWEGAKSFLAENIRGCRKR
ncbi:MAG TPA: YqiA/YcfP family alpha/beta fold hydrolase [Bryobacteraceae bacterium]|jgi:hypothetical protein|nr:YqiA/YcfP family alpha/beta fold hydrolase [Bryobacteraceae bacterium]